MRKLRKGKRPLGQGGVESIKQIQEEEAAGLILRLTRMPLGGASYPPAIGESL
jgi:hypothetical protein